MDTQRFLDGQNGNEGGHSETHSPFQSCDGSRKELTNWIEDTVESVLTDKLCEACLRVYASMIEADEKPGSEAWLILNRRRIALEERIESEWWHCIERDCSNIKANDYPYPYSGDFVVRAFVQCRKLTTAAKNALFERFGMDFRVTRGTEAA